MTHRRLTIDAMMFLVLFLGMAIELVRSKLVNRRLRGNCSAYERPSRARSVTRELMAGS